MVNPALNRRALLAGLAALGVAPSALLANAPVTLSWADLLPEGQPMVPPALPELLRHDGPDMSRQQPPSLGVRTEWNGKAVRMPGFVVPIDQSGTGITAFILVPFVGACVHVPPPPANQLVFVTTQTPYESGGLFEAVNVTGTFGTVSTFTELADVAYALSADQIEPF